MSPCMAATYGMPPNRYGFQSGKPFPSRSAAAANSRKANPAMYWSLCGLTRNCPVSAGHASDSAATAYVATASAYARCGRATAVSEVSMVLVIRRRGGYRPSANRQRYVCDRAGAGVDAVDESPLRGPIVHRAVLPSGTRAFQYGIVELPIAPRDRVRSKTRECRLPAGLSDLMTGFGRHHPVQCGCE